MALLSISSELLGRINNGIDTGIYGAVSAERISTLDIGGRVSSYEEIAVLGLVTEARRVINTFYGYIDPVFLIEEYQTHIDEVRNILNDYVNVNDILEEEQVSDEGILKALNRVLREYNNFPPVKTSFTLANHPYIDTIYLGAVAHLLRSLAISELRNQVDYSSPTTQIGVHTKWQSYQSLSDRLMQDYEYKRTTEKNIINLESAYGAAPFLDNYETIWEDYD